MTLIHAKEFTSAMGGAIARYIYSPISSLHNGHRTLLTLYSNNGTSTQSIDRCHISTCPTVSRGKGNRYVEINFQPLHHNLNVNHYCRLVCDRSIASFQRLPQSWVSSRPCIRDRFLSSGLAQYDKRLVARGGS
jgi:hypothetical protein